MGGCGHIPHNLIGGFILPPKLNLIIIMKPEIKFEVNLTRVYYHEFFKSAIHLVLFWKICNKSLKYQIGF